MTGFISSGIEPHHGHCCWKTPREPWSLPTASCGRFCELAMPAWSGPQVTALPVVRVVEEPRLLMGRRQSHHDPPARNPHLRSPPPRSTQRSSAGSRSARHWTGCRPRRSRRPPHPPPETSAADPGHDHGHQQGWRDHEAPAATATPAVSRQDPAPAHAPTRSRSGDIVRLLRRAGRSGRPLRRRTTPVRSGEAAAASGRLSGRPRNEAFGQGLTAGSACSPDARQR